MFMCPTISKYLPLPACTLCNAHVSQHWSQKVHQVPELKRTCLWAQIFRTNLSRTSARRKISNRSKCDCQTIQSFSLSRMNWWGWMGSWADLRRVDHSLEGARDNGLSIMDGWRKMQICWSNGWIWLSVVLGTNVFYSSAFMFLGCF